MTTTHSYFATTLAPRKIQILDKREKENILLTATNFPQNVWHLIANFTSANACPGDESENYGFIKRILSSEEAHVWRRICLDWHISHNSAAVLLLTPHLSSAPVLYSVWTPWTLTSMRASISMQIRNCTSSALCLPAVQATQMRQPLPVLMEVLLL